jgi:hypothetical protein
MDYTVVVHMNWRIFESIYSLLLQHETEGQNSIPVHFRTYCSMNENVILQKFQNYRFRSPNVILPKKINKY